MKGSLAKPYDCKVNLSFYISSSFGLTSIDVVVQSEDGLLEVVDSGEGSRATDTRRAVQNYFVIGLDVCLLFRVEHALASALAPVVQADVLNDRL